MRGVAQRGLPVSLVYQLTRELGLEFTELQMQGELVLQLSHGELNHTVTRHLYGKQPLVGWWIHSITSTEKLIDGARYQMVRESDPTDEKAV